MPRRELHEILHVLFDVLRYLMGYFILFFIFRAILMTYGISQTKGQIGAAARRSTPQPQQHRIQATLVISIAQLVATPDP